MVFLALPVPSQIARAQDPAELRLALPPGLTSGAQIEASVRIAATEASILSWSLSVRLEGLVASSTTTSGTDLDRLSQGGFAESGLLPDGSAFYSVGVLSFLDVVALPIGLTEVLKTRCLISRKDPGLIRLVPSDGLKLPDDDREISNRILVVGGETRALATSPRELRILGCAGLMLDLKEPPAQAIQEVRRNVAFKIGARLHIDSSDHMSPTGFSLGVKQDPALLALDSTALLESFLVTFVKPDGFARLEVGAGGFAVAVLSSASDPPLLAPGDHSFVEATYRFVGSGRPGDKLTTAIEVAEGLPIQGEPTPVFLQPRDTLPCELNKIALELVIGPDWWIRGDSNSDGKADLSDAIVTLQHLFAGGTVDCARAMEINRDGRVDISDPIALLAHLFTGGPAPAAPFPGCGVAEETLDCARFPCPAT